LNDNISEIFTTGKVLVDFDQLLVGDFMWTEMEESANERSWDVPSQMNKLSQLD
jgi:ERCC4-type nuclease